DILLSDREDKTFEPFDRFAQFKDSKGKSLQELLDEFSMRRRENLAILESKRLTASDLEREGQHPALGTVTLAQLLASWVVHDLNHIAQVSRVMAHQYSEEVGPWKDYMGILSR
ncbi:MAG: DinB family protein, partial [Flavobacteriaceae bacterium]